MSAAVVTFADEGAGPAIAGRLAERGYDVVRVTRSPEGLRSHVGTEVAAACRDRSVELLVNNMPTLPVGTVMDTATTVFAGALDVGLNSLFSACREAAAAAMRNGTPLLVVNVVSALGLVGLEGRAAEASGSAAMLAATKALAAEWGPSGIRVAAVAVGPTEAWGNTLEETPGLIPTGRFVTSEDVAGAVVLLAGSDAESVDGSPLIVDGGWLAYGHREGSA